MIITTNHDLFVDTSGWSCYLVEDEEHHEDAITICQRYIESGRNLVTTNYVLSELFALLMARKRLPRSAIVAAVETMITQEFIHIIQITEEIDTATLDLLKNRQDKAWSWVDASSFVVMQQRGSYML